MTQDEIIEMARQAGFEDLDNWTLTSMPWLCSRLEAFAKLVAAKERDAIAQMFENAPTLVEFARNDQGGCIMCGFTPEKAVTSIRARGKA